MQPKKYATIASIGVKTLGLALASSCLLYSAANAAGLGKLTVLSALGQPLRAEIELTSVTKDDIGNLTPKLASVEAFKQANIEFSANLKSLKFSVEERGTRQFVVLTTVQSVNDPYVELLLELNSSSGKLTREYTLLIDPLEMQANNSVASAATSSSTSASVAATTDAKEIVSPSPVNSIANSSVVTSPVATTPVSPVAQDKLGTSSSPANSTNSVTSTTSAGKSNGPVRNNPGPSMVANGDYQIKNGDTLGKIADQFKPVGVSLDQMLVALHKSNPNAFINNNMNLLRSGKILAIPGAAEIESTSNPEAKKIVLAQSIDFNAYRNKLANQVAQATPERATESKKTDGGKITAKVTETPTSANESKDKLKLSKAQLQEQADKKAQEEDKIAKQRALEAANERVKELEKNTAKLQSLLELKNKAACASASVPPKTAAASQSASASSAASVSIPLPKVEADVPASMPARKPVVRPAVAPVSAPIQAPTPGIVDRIIQYLPYGAAFLALLGLIGIAMSKRKKKSDTFDDESILTGSSMKANSLFGSTGGQSVDTNNSVFNSNFAPSASQLDANEVDPVAEADVYIAYGRDEQAEEILKEALRTQPERQAVRVKLLEIYAHRKDTHTFETVASELYGMTGGDGADWAQAASLGILIDPQNPLYAGGQTGGHSAVLGASTLPVESLDPEALLGNSLSQQMLDSIATKQDGNPSSLMGDVSDTTQRMSDMNDDLDFDLGLSDTTGISKNSGFTSNFSNSANEITIQQDDVHADLQFERPAATVQPAVKSTSSANIASAGNANVDANENSEDNNALDFAALDFDIDFPSANPSEKSPVTAPAPQSVERISAKQEPAVDLEIPRYTLPIPEPIVSSSAFEFDLSGIDLDLPKTSSETSHGEPNFASASSGTMSNDIQFAAAATAAGEIELEEPISQEEVNSEMATKLDLAVAYQEIGDKDGARELLEEVMKAGNQEQIARAKNMLKELS